LRSVAERPHDAGHRGDEDVLKITDQISRHNPSSFAHVREKPRREIFRSLWKIAGALLQSQIGGGESRFLSFRWLHFFVA
jgi:hypothetical protein